MTSLPSPINQPAVANTAVDMNAIVEIVQTAIQSNTVNPVYYTFFSGVS